MSKMMGGRLRFGQSFGDPKKGVVFGCHLSSGPSFGATKIDRGSAAQPDPTLTPRNGALERGRSRKAGSISELRKSRPWTHRNSRRRDVQNGGGETMVWTTVWRPRKGCRFRQPSQRWGLIWGDKNRQRFRGSTGSNIDAPESGTEKGMEPQTGSNFGTPKKSSSDTQKQSPPRCPK